MSHSAHSADDDFTGRGRASSDRWQPSRLTRRMRRRPTSTCCSPCATFLTCNLSPLARPHRVPVVVQIERSACQKTRRGKVLLPSSSHNREGKGVINSPTSIEGRRGTDRGRGRRSKAPPAERRANIPMSNGSEGTDVETPSRARRLDTCALQGVHVWQRIA